MPICLPHTLIHSRFGGITSDVRLVQRKHSPDFSPDCSEGDLCNETIQICTATDTSARNLDPSIYPNNFHQENEGSAATKLNNILKSNLYTYNQSSKMSSDSEKTGTTTFQDEAINSPPMATEVPWWKQPLLRRLYFMMTFLFLGSTTLGYDGSVLNGLQTMTSWQDCKNHP